MTCGRRLIAFAILLSALMSGIAAPPARAQTWEGTVEVSVNSLKFDEEGEAFYKVRLSEPPTEDNWWVRVFVDGAARSEGNYKGYEWVPSVGFEFDKDNWDQWREIRVIKTENAKENVMFSHEVWNHKNDCPVHNVGQVTTGPKGSGNNGGDGDTGGGNTGGDNTGGDNTGGDNTDGGNTDGGGNNGVGTDSLQNNAPVLDDPGTLTIEENVGSTTRPAENVGSPVTASDADNDPLTFTLEGAEAQFFSIGRTSGQIMTRSGAVYDREAKESYTVTVKVSDGRASDTVDLVAAQGEATRLRLIGEGSRAFEVGGGTLTLTGEGGLRHDGGDADKGVGILVGGGVRYRARGYTVRGHAHGVLAHAENGFGEWGITGEVRINPGQLGRGFFLTVAPGWGAGPGGIERMQSAPGGAPGVDGAQAFAAEGRLNTEIGYGLRAPVGAGLLTPHAGLSLSMRGTQQWRAGARWRIAPQTVFGFEGTRDVTRGPEPAAHSILFRANARW